MLNLVEPASLLLYGIRSKFGWEQFAAPDAGESESAKQRDGACLEKENSCGAIWRRAHWRSYRAADAGKKLDRNHRGDRFGSCQSGARPGRRGGRSRCAVG